ncbi:phage late control D family protein [Methylosinus sp. KRF6]|uniref:phage late control D family protein n=1 Tax=Methylosinus sp. KRF6 TaxID=2846853 RepID=UPI001C0BE3CD|nr:contractile injection system protein, VgrG/Pvc8 family [Methylosinus sp. KRF6]MBU3887203.1 late control protein D [Methylosinus sp. KRF6]
MTEMTNYTIIVDGNAVTNNFAPFLISLSISLSDGGESDSLSIELDDAHGSLRLPREGADISVTLAWSSGGKAISFDGKVDEIESHGSRSAGITLSITARSVDFKGLPKQKLLAHRDDATFGEVATSWAKKAGLEAKVDSALANIRRSYWLISNESFLAWGERMARELGATFKVFGAKAVFVSRNSGSSTSGKALSGVTATYGENLIDWSLSPVRNRPRYSQSVVGYYDPKKAKHLTKKVAIGDNGAQVDLIDRRRAADSNIAQQRASSNSEEAKRDKGGGSVTIDGEPAAQPQTLLTLSGARPGIDGVYRITGVTHTYSRHGGWTTACQVEQPQGKVGDDDRK